MSGLARLITRFEHKEIKQFFAQKRPCVRRPAFDLLKAPALKNFGRILIITSRKVGNAPQRNTIRRRLKSLFFEYTLYKNPYDYVVIIKKQAVTLLFNQLKEIFLKEIG